LPVQVHPDKETAAKFFNSKYGKTEAWIVLDTRSVNGEEPCLLFGFNENFDEDIFTREALDGNMTKSLSMLHKHPVKSGDILLVNGGIPHAIGAGVFLVEIMEPTDLVIQPELYCGSQRLTVEERFCEVSPEKALKVFQCQKLSKIQAWENAFIEPTVIDKTVNAELSLLIDRNEIKFFGAKKLNFSGKYLYQNTDNCCAAGIVCDGTLNIKYKNDYCLELKKGDTFFLPDQINDCIFNGSGELIFALPPVPESSKVNKTDQNGR
jgi:mannose-6-phosphate isomerase